jgi:hypothetical protein
MRTKRSIKWGLVAAAAACVAVTAVPGCELLVDFDRSKIPEEGGLLDSTTGLDATEDGTTSETSSESSTGDDGGDGGDAATDSPVTDAPLVDEGPPDTGSDAPPDTGGDSSSTDGASDSGDDGSDASGD